MADIGVPELLIILAIVIVLFGPSRLAGLGRSVGQGIREFRQGIREQDGPAGEGVSSSEEALKS